MKAVLLAGGFGTRLRPLTYTRPKHLLPICNRAHIEHVLDLLQRHGINAVVLTTSYLAEAFTDTVQRITERGMHMEVTHEEVPLGTAGAIKNAQSVIGGDTFLVFNADVLTDADLGELLDFHRDKRAEATILLTPVEDPSAFGVVPTDEDGRVTGFIEKPPPGQAPTDLINAGAYVLEPSVLDRIPDGEESSVERSLFPELVADGARLFALPTKAYWMDVGTPEKYLQANMDALEERITLEGPGPIHPSARVHDKAVVASSCLGAGASIEGEAHVRGSVLLPGVVVCPGAQVEGCILGEEAVVASGEKLVNRTVADHEKVG